MDNVAAVGLLLKLQAEDLAKNAQKAGEEAGKAAAQGIESSMGKGVDASKAIGSDLTQEAQKVGQDAGAALTDGLNKTAQEASNVGAQIGQETGSAMQEGLNQTAQDAGSAMTQGLEQAAQEASQVGTEIGQETGSAMKEGLNQAAQDTAQVGSEFGQKAGEAIVQGVKQAAKETSSAGKEVGKEVGSSITDGVKDETKDAGKDIISKDVKSEVISDAKEVGEQAGESIASGMSGAAGSVMSVAKKLMGALGAVFAVGKLVDFGKECLELGSDLAEVQNVVDVAFGDMSSEIDEWAKTAMTSFGMSETMAKQYAGTFGAMAKSFGYSQSEAVDMAEAVTQLAGDVASFYNLDADTAYTKMKSIFTGETESLKDLGVVMTQTALDEFALANGFGKTTSSMSEQEKVALRLAFVQDKLSDASGDFARTSGSWANQTKILALQFDSLKASIGQGLINVLTPAIQWLNALLAKINEVAAGFATLTAKLMGVESGDSASGTGAIASDLAVASDSADSLSSSMDSVGSSAKKAQQSLAGFDKINTLTSSASSGGGGGGSSVTAADLSLAEATTDASEEAESALAGLAAAFQPIRDEFAKGFEMSWNGDGLVDEVEQDIVQIKESITRIVTDPEVQNSATRCVTAWATASGAVSGMVATMSWAATKTVTGSIQEFLDKEEEPIKNHLVTMFDLSTRQAEATTTLATSVSNIVAGVAESGEWEGVGSNILAVTFDGAAIASQVVQSFSTGITEGFAESLSENENVFTQFGINVGATLETITDIFRDDWDTILEKLDASWMADIWADISAAVGDMIASITDGFNRIWPIIHPVAVILGDILSKILAIGGQALISIGKTLMVALKAVLNVLKGLVDIVVGLFTFDFKKADKGLEEIYDAVVELFKDLWDVLFNLVDSILSIFKVDEWIGEAILAICDWFQKARDKIAEIFGNIGEWFGERWDDICEVFSNIGTWFSEKFTEAKDSIHNVFTGIGDWFGERWTDIKNAFSAVGTWFSEKFTEGKDSIHDVFTGIGDWFGERWTDITNAFSAVGTWFSDTFTEAYNNLTAAFDNISTWASELWDTVKEKFTEFGTNVGDAVGGAFTSVINGVLETIENTVNSAFGFINSAIDFINDNIPGVSIGHIEGVSLPRLAQGGFVEANTPQLAVIGDNKHEGEIVAPESKISEAVTAGMMAILPYLNGMGTQQTAAASSNQNITLELDGRVIWDSMNNYTQMNNRRSGGRA